MQVEADGVCDSCCRPFELFADEAAAADAVCKRHMAVADKQLERANSTNTDLLNQV